MPAILLDTSSIVFAFSNKVDLFAKVEERLDAKPLISAGVMRELQKLSKRKTKEGRAAKMALQVIENHRIVILSDNGPVDDFLVRAGTEGRIAVCTNDIGLKKRLKSKGAKPLSVSRSGVLR